MKDRHATTRQWVSVPRWIRRSRWRPRSPAAGCWRRAGTATSCDGAPARQPLRGGLDRGRRGGRAALRALLGAGRDGLPNTYGAQRFGGRGRQRARGAGASARAAARAGLSPGGSCFCRRCSRRCFNRALHRRGGRWPAQGAGRGTCCRRPGSGGLFVTEDPARDQARVDAGEVVPTGPMPGSREVEPPEGSEAWQLESEALAEVGVTRAELAAVGRDSPGARRPVLVKVTLGEPPVSPSRGGCGCASRCPPGSYATVVLQALRPGCPRPAARSKPVLTFRVPAGPSRFSPPSSTSLGTSHADHGKAPVVHPPRLRVGAVAA
jgi:tRNA pseudouridine13 synthase